MWSKVLFGNKIGQSGEYINKCEWRNKIFFGTTSVNHLNEMVRESGQMDPNSMLLFHGIAWDRITQIFIFSLCKFLSPVLIFPNKQKNTLKQCSNAGIRQS